MDTGTTFDEHFNDAYKQIFDMGYESIVAIGGDVPTMPKSHLTQAFQWLEYFQSIGKPGFVQAPCQECGTSLVGYSYNTPINHDGIYYNMDGRPALDGYMEKLQNKAETAGFDRSDMSDALDKLSGEVAKLRQAEAEQSAVADRLGEVLFAAVQVGRAAGVDPEESLGNACERFIRRFRVVERRAGQQGLTPEETAILWDEIKSS